jgi:hypothetical protein
LPCLFRSWKAPTVNVYNFTAVQAQTPEIVKNCKRWAEVFSPDYKPREKHAQDLNSYQADDGLQPGSSCEIRFFDEAKNYSVYYYSTIEVLQQLVKTPEEKDEFLFGDLATRISPFTLNHTPGGGGSSKPEECSYDPFKTATFIENLLKDKKCIQRVYVPETWLVKRLKAQGSRVIYRPMLEYDRFLVDAAEMNCKEAK